MQQTNILTFTRTDKETEQSSAKSLPRWRQSILGYPAGFLLVVFMVLISTLLREPHFVWSPFCLATVVTGFIWGVGPALVTMLLGFVALDLFIMADFHLLSPMTWADSRIFGPFIVAQFIVALLAAQNARKHSHILHLKQKLDVALAELTLTNQRLQASNHFKDYFVTRAAHELRTPLTAIIGEAQLALRRLRKQAATVDTARWERHFEHIQDGMHRLHILVEGLVEINTLTSGELSLKMRDCDIVQLCQDVITEQQAVSSHPIVFESPVDRFMIQADPILMMRAILNILQNAIQYARSSTGINIDVELRPATVILQFHNQSLTLSPEEQSHLFEPFYRTPYAEQVYHDGLGLGLTVSKAVIEKHGGTIQVASSNKSGFTCSVKLPVQQQTDEQLQHSESDQQAVSA